MEQLLIDVDAEDELKRQEERHVEEAIQNSLLDQNHSSKDIEELNEEISSMEAQILRLQAAVKSLRETRAEKIKEIRNAQAAPWKNDVKGKRKDGGNTTTIDYTSLDFEWSGALSAKLKSAFGFDEFRLCQEGICNASIDRRDVVAIMPTGGGKSLGYQLPALMVPGCTLVISPLLALISDQIMHLRENNVDAVMLTSATSREESDNIYKRLRDMASGATDMDIKLCYVTPEKIAKSKTFKSALSKLYEVGKLARFVIDEAHCVSQQGHDFRPDYQRLSALRQLFPDVPILALSATCPAAVLTDLLKILGMPALTLGSSAAVKGTVLFSTSLYRKNLHYTVLPKPSGSNESIAAMCKYILDKHPHDTGIVYCLTKKDVESVAETLHNLSEGKIKTGVYHADVTNAQKETLHRQWHHGKIKVVCATIAFGLGIDKGDVRFVIHHSLSKTLDGFYQESGRAGRDGKAADCVLYYRPQDAIRIASLNCDEHGGQDKALAMIAFASNLEECRKVQFANYFNKSSRLSFDSWRSEGEDAHTRCGHCDNCTRSPDTFERLGERHIRVAAWQILRVARATSKQVTLAQLCDLARGLGRGSSARDDYDGGSRGKGKGKGKGRAKATVDINEVAGGKVDLSKEQTETLCTKLLVDGYLSMSFQHTDYTVNVYLKPSPMAERFVRFEKADIERGKGPAFDCVFLKKGGKSKSAVAAAATRTRVAVVKLEDRSNEATGINRLSTAVASSSTARGKRKRVPSPTSTADEDGDIAESENAEEIESDCSESDPDDKEWQTTLRGKGKAPVLLQIAKKPRNSLAIRRPVMYIAGKVPLDDDVIELSSD